MEQAAVATAHAVPKVEQWVQGIMGETPGVPGEDKVANGSRVWRWGGRHAGLTRMGSLAPF